MTSSHRLRFVAVVAAAWLVTSPSAHAQDEKSLDRAPVRCIDLGRLQRMEVVDEQTVLFFLPGNRVYRNTLHSRCPHLDRNIITRGWLTPSRLTRLCAKEVVGTEDGPCKFGEFEPITPEEAKDLSATKK